MQRLVAFSQKLMSCRFISTLNVPHMVLKLLQSAAPFWPPSITKSQLGYVAFTDAGKLQTVFTTLWYVPTSSLQHDPIVAKNQNDEAFGFLTHFPVFLHVLSTYGKKHQHIHHPNRSCKWVCVDMNCMAPFDKHSNAFRHSKK